MLDWLENRGTAWRQARVDCVAGIYGGLDPDETWLPADALGGLPLPHIDATLPAIAAGRVAATGACAGGNGCVLLPAVLRAFAWLATTQGRGLLWGLDVTPPRGRGSFHHILDDRCHRVRRGDRADSAADLRSRGGRRQHPGRPTVRPRAHGRATRPARRALDNPGTPVGGQRDQDPHRHPGLRPRRAGLRHRPRDAGQGS